MFTDEELRILLDAVMVFCKAAEAAPENDGSDLAAIDALQHKIERLLGQPAVVSDEFRRQVKEAMDSNDGLLRKLANS